MKAQTAKKTIGCTPALLSVSRINANKGFVFKKELGIPGGIS